MKKYFLLLVAAVSTIGAFAQPGQGSQIEIMKLKTADGKVVRYEISNVSELSFGSLFHTFEGYILANNAYFQDYYAGSTTTLGVYNASNGYDVHFSDAIWGEAEFENVSMAMGQLSGTGSITISQQYGGKTFDATISGPMTTPTIDIPGLMQGGTKLTFYIGTVPPSILVKGNHQGSISVMVGDNYGPYVNSQVKHVITANADGTINVVIPEYTLDNTAIGNLTLGTYTISNIAYDTEKGAFYRDYKDDGLQFHFKAVNGGTTTIDGDYLFTNLGNITIQKTDAGVSIVNNFKPTRADGGGMPMNISATFTEAQSNPHQ